MHWMRLVLKFRKFELLLQRMEDGRVGNVLDALVEIVDEMLGEQSAIILTVRKKTKRKRKEIQ